MRIVVTADIPVLISRGTEHPVERRSIPVAWRTHGRWKREVIEDLAALLTAFQQKEIEAIQRSGITHAPTIGAQYEGITGSILKMMIPPELELQVVSGFVQGVDGTLSGQVDGMLVRGSGTPIPGVQGQYKWSIKDVGAVLEVKKTLFGSDVADAHDQLQSVMALFWAYAEIIKPSDGIDISAPCYVYSQILGELRQWVSNSMPLPLTV